MNKGQGRPKTLPQTKIPSGGLPIIGEADKEAIQEAIRSIIEYIDPILANIGQAVEQLQQRVSVVEEVKQIFPSTVNVYLHHKIEKNPVFESVKIVGKKEEKK